MRALLVCLVCASAPAVAGPKTSPQPQVETFSFSISQGRLGLTVLGMTPELRVHLGAAADRGVLVARVEADSPAALAGVVVGDVLVEVHGKKVDGAGDVLAALSRSGRGEPVTIHVLRDRKLVTLTATLVDAPAPNTFDHPRLRELMKSHPSLLREFFDDSWFDHERFFQELPRPVLPRDVPRKPRALAKPPTTRA